MTDVIKVDGVVIAFTEKAYKEALAEQARLIESSPRRSAIIKSK